MGVKKTKNNHARISGENTSVPSPLPLAEVDTRDRNADATSSGLGAISRGRFTRCLRTANRKCEPHNSARAHVYLTYTCMRRVLTAVRLPITRAYGKFPAPGYRRGVTRFGRRHVRAYPSRIMIYKRRHAGYRAG